MSFEIPTEKVTYQCDSPLCTDAHETTIVNFLPPDALSYDDISNLPDGRSGIKAAVGSDSFASYQGPDQEYKESHTDLIAILYEDDIYVLRLIARTGWEIGYSIALEYLKEAIEEGTSRETRDKLLNDGAEEKLLTVAIDLYLS